MFNNTSHMGPVTWSRGGNPIYLHLNIFGLMETWNIIFHVPSYFRLEHLKNGSFYAEFHFLDNFGLIEQEKPSFFLVLPTFLVLNA